MTNGKPDFKNMDALEKVNYYARSVLDGSIVAGPHVRNSCRRHFSDLDSGHERGLFFDVKAADHKFRFFEEGLTLSDGQFEGKPFRMSPMQHFIIGSLFGWKVVDPDDPDAVEEWAAAGKPDYNAKDKRYYAGMTFRNGFAKFRKKKAVRRFRRAFIEMGKGNGKSPLAGGIGLIGLVADDEPGSQVYAAAAKKEQAQILYQDACKMVRRSPELAPPFIEFSGSEGKEYNMLHKPSMSFFKPISKDAGKSGSGPRPHMALCDEVHEHPDRSVMEMLERGFKARRNPLLLMITNSGVDRGSICWEEHELACNVAAGTQNPDDDFTYVGETFDGSDENFSYVCALDKDDDPFEDPSCWVKANPMLGVILKPSYIANVVAQAKTTPGKRNGILRLHFCQWTDSVNGWMTQEIVSGAMHDFDPVEEHGDKEIAVGIDLSSARDLTAMAGAVITGSKTVTRIEEDGSEVTKSLPTYDVWVEAWTPGDTVQARADATKRPYDVWVKDGHLRAVAGERIRFDHVAYQLQRLVTEFDVLGVAYDNYAYSAFRQECDDLGIVVDHFSHPQGGKKRAKPTDDEIREAEAEGKEPEPGLWMPGSIKLFEDAMIDKRIRIRASPVVMAALMGATMSDEDDLGNKWFVKSKSNAAIDPAVAIAMALGLLDRRSKAETSSPYEILVIG